MNFTQLQKELDSRPDAPILFKLPDQSIIPAHYHITEIGYGKKDFIDCGGVRRTNESCLLQLWVAHDTDHQLKSKKVAGILHLAEKLFPNPELPVEVEYQQKQGEINTIALFSLLTVTSQFGKLVFILENKATACLAPDKCGIPGCC